MYVVSTPVIYLAILKFKLPSFLASRSKMAELKGDFPDSFFSNWYVNITSINICISSNLYILHIIILYMVLSKFDYI